MYIPFSYLRTSYTRAQLNTIEYLVVGGGGGGAWYGGGGGAGGFLSGSIELSQNQTFNVYVGNGAPSSSNANFANNGQTSSLLSTEYNISVLGGGGGGAYLKNGRSGSSGGGGGAADGFSAPTDIQTYGGSGFTPQGNAGGNNSPKVGTDVRGAGGGGGATYVGTDGSGGRYAGNGGDGKAWVNGTYYAGGGGGGSLAIAVGGVGGLGGGGSAPYNYIDKPTSGTPNTGGGGGGGGSQLNSGSAGGSGIVIIRYEDLGVSRATGGTITTSGSYVYHTFTTGSNTFQFNVTY
jgi:hypothetical protein